MALKFAKKNVNRWKNRYLNEKEVIQALRIRMRNGFTLTLDERTFYDDIKSLFERYNPTKSFYDWSNPKNSEREAK